LKEQIVCDCFREQRLWSR